MACTQAYLSDLADRDGQSVLDTKLKESSLRVVYTMHLLTSQVLAAALI